jgi:hypothetical protein
LAFGQYFLNLKISQIEELAYSALSKGSMSAILLVVDLKLEAAMRGTTEVIRWGVVASELFEMHELSALSTYPLPSFRS